VPASRLVPKVQQDDQMQHKLDRGLGRIPWKSDRGTKSLSSEFPFQSSCVASRLTSFPRGAGDAGAAHLSGSPAAC